MITPVSKIFRRKEAGFLLTEVLIALIIASIVAIAASVMVVQLISVKSTNANNVTVTSNINSATDSLVPDVQMCELEITEKDGVYTILNIGQADDGDWKEEYPETGVVIFTHDGTGDAKWLCLEWEWEVKDTSDQTEYHQVIYDIKDGRLDRTHKIYKRIYALDGTCEETLTSETSTMIAQYIDEGATNWKLIYDKETKDATVEITISASTGGYKSASESRTIQVLPRITL